MRKLLLYLFILSAGYGRAQSTLYRETPVRINDLVHTKLDVRFDYKKCYLYGKEWITIKPHAYATDSLSLDAKGMDIKAVGLIKGKNIVPLRFKYLDSLAVKIELDKTYQAGEEYVVYLAYTAKPNELKVHGSAAITSAKGLYFINPDSAVKGKPVQVWTQGETESASCWFPTIDKPNQKCTEEISMSVPSKYITLSNGYLASKKLNKDGTRTDTWKMDLPHSPYLFMMAVGDFKVYHDHWRNKPVDYYLEPKYAPYAKQIFGQTPEMMEFYSKTLGVDFPWNKYAQIVVRDYVSGAMENTSATLHGEYVQETARELADNGYDERQSTIAHELFHQWFGDLVTCESWSNLTVNESFADFSESLWADHKYGKDEGDAHRFTAMQNYLHTPGADTKNLVRFDYADKEDMFDNVTYNKGGRILDMLRDYLGDAVFFKGLQTYLKANAFGNGEAQQLRLALEQASGRDLNWFFNEWYYGAGHPVLDISYAYANNVETIIIKQNQKNIFQFPVAVDVYSGDKKERQQVWINGSVDTLRFVVNSKPDLVNFDADKVLLCQKSDHKTLTDYEFQYAHAPLYLDRLEALDTAIAHKDNSIIVAALKDPYFGLRLKAVNASPMPQAQVLIRDLAERDPDNRVRAAAINALAKIKEPTDFFLFDTWLNSSSYAVQGAALNGLILRDSGKALQLAKIHEKESEGALTEAIIQVYLARGNDAQRDFIQSHFNQLNPQSQYNLMGLLAGMTARLNDVNAQQAIQILQDFGLRFKATGVAPVITGLLTQVGNNRTALKDRAAMAIKMINETK